MKPVVAAVYGTALYCELEVAPGWYNRVAVASFKEGLLNAKLGLLFGVRAAGHLSQLGGGYCGPDEMGIGPFCAIQCLLTRKGVRASY